MDELPEPVRGLEITTQLGASLPLDLKLVDSRAREITLADILSRARPAVIAMIYLRCPLLCPKVQQEIISSFSRLDFTVGSEFDAVLVSFDPRDGPREAERAKTDALLLYERVTTDSIRQGWHYLTGTAENTRALADALGFPYRYIPASGEYSHGTAIFVVTPQGVISRCFTKLDYDPSDLRLALVEASSGKIGSFIDRFTLWCYHWDPSGAKYIIAPMRIMQIGSGFCAALLLAFVAALALRDRHRRAGRSRIAFDSSHPVTPSPSHPLTLSPSHRLTVSPSPPHPLTPSPSHPLTQ
jgi:protein SCO1/2